MPTPTSRFLAEMLGGARLPLHLQAIHGNSTVIRAIVRMEDPTHGLCPLVHDIHRGDHTGPGGVVWEWYGFM